MKRGWWLVFGGCVVCGFVCVVWLLVPRMLRVLLGVCCIVSDALDASDASGVIGWLVVALFRMHWMPRMLRSGIVSDALDALDASDASMAMCCIGSDALDASDAMSFFCVHAVLIKECHFKNGQHSFYVQCLDIVMVWVPRMLRFQCKNVFLCECTTYA